MFLSEKFYKGYGHSPVHLLNKCETCNKNRRESNAVTKSREALSFSAFLVIFFAFAKSDIIATAIVILKPCGFSSILFALKARDAHCVSREYHSARAEYHCVAISLATGE